MLENQNQDRLRLYTCTGNKMTEVKNPRCEDCKHFRPLYYRDASHHYIQINVGCCALKDKGIGGQSISWRSGLDAPSPCGFFEPMDIKEFRKIWMKIPKS